MKKVYNKLTTTDVPLDASLDIPPRSVPKTSSTTKKSTIQAIGSKAKTTSKSGSKTTTKMPAKTSLQKTSTTQKVSSKAASAQQNEIPQKGSVRKKLSKESIDIKDLEKLNEENLKSYSFRSKRNQAIVILLSILLVLAIAFIVIFAVVNNTENNCFLHVQGNVDASYTVNGDEISEFRSPANLIGDCIFEFEVNLNIKSSGLYKVKFTISCYYEDKLLPSVVVYEPNIGDDGLFEYKSDGYYHSKSNINGGSTIHLCRGVALNEFDINMDVDKFRLEVQTIVEKA